MFFRPSGNTLALACLAVWSEMIRYDLSLWVFVYELRVPSVLSLLPQPTLPLSISPLSACPSESMVDFQDPTVIAQDYCAYYMFSDLAPSR
jgi:hypothetical protein